MESSVLVARIPDPLTPILNFIRRANHVLQHIQNRKRIFHSPLLRSSRAAETSPPKDFHYIQFLIIKPSFEQSVLMSKLKFVCGLAQTGDSQSHH